MTLLDEVRQKVIEALGEQEFYDPHFLNGELGGDPFPRPITLADVLLAIGAKYPFKPMQTAEYYLVCDLWGNLCDANGVDMAKWNLSASLDDQPEDVIKFLHSILV